jgi:hypothetical protein
VLEKKYRGETEKNEEEEQRDGGEGGVQHFIGMKEAVQYETISNCSTTGTWDRPRVLKLRVHQK